MYNLKNEDIKNSEKSQFTFERVPPYSQSSADIKRRQEWYISIQTIRRAHCHNIVTLNTDFF